MKRVLVTGANSFTARHLLARLGSRPAPAGAGRLRLAREDGRQTAGPDDFELAGFGFGPAPAPRIPYREVDLRDREAVRLAVQAAAPELVFHLAGIASPDEGLCYAVNLDGTRHLLEACARLSPAPRVLVVSSSAVYGQTRPGESPVREETPLRPVTAYGASKAAAEISALSFHRRGLLPVIVARPFNLVGPGLPAGLAPADFMAQALRIREGAAPPEIRAGNLAPRRDYVDARDAARAYLELAASDEAPGSAFNVASGRAVAIADLLQMILDAAGVAARVTTDPDRLRPVDVLEQVGDASAIRRLAGWAPEIPLEDSLRDMAGA
jgi:GDP-4-dehydro-6-deoxy-D-mannose reductase